MPAEKSKEVSKLVAEARWLTGLNRVQGCGALLITTRTLKDTLLT